MNLTKNQLNGYTLGKTIGRGTFGKVKLATHQRTGEPVAIKVLEKDKIKDVTDVERVSRELHILKITQHSSIAQMYEVIETMDKIFIVMQYAPFGEFFDYVMDAKIKNQDEAHHFFVQIVAGLQYLHKLNISHRDVKPENMLLDHNRRLKIVDFGLSNMYKKGEALLTACGSPCYASPEMIKGQEYDPELTDVWSLGVVLFSMIFAKLPFEDDNTSVLYSKIKSGLYVIDKKVSPELRDLLSKMLNVKPKNRYNLQAIKEHPWFKKQRGLKCNGLVVGYENLPLDQTILAEMVQLGYDEKLCRRYLQNNIRNESTSAYYLIMKRYFIRGQPSPYDICCESFQKKLLIPKKSKVNLRSQSTDPKYTTPPNKETIQFQEQINPFNSIKINPSDNLKKGHQRQVTDMQQRKHKRFNTSALSKERNCFSQMKSDEYDRNMKNAKPVFLANRYGLTHGISFNNNERTFKGAKDSYKKGITTNHEVRDSLSRSKKSDKSLGQKSRKKSIDGKNLEKQQNISINVYINNAKIETPYHGKKTPTHPQHKNSSKKLNKHLAMFGQSRSRKKMLEDGPYALKKADSSHKRLRTQANERDIWMKRQSKRYCKDIQLESKSLQKSHEINLFDGSFWKKKSLNHRNRDHTTESRSGAHNPHIFRRY